MAAADGITYFKIDGAPGRYLRCIALRSTLSESACARKWRAAQTEHGATMGTTGACRNCAIGARHAGAAHVERSSLHKAGICPRCGDGAARMIGGRLCVSCYNREREWRIGRDGKGTVPCFTFEPRRIGIVTTAGLFTVRDDATAHTAELAIQALRVANEPVMFTRAISPVIISTKEFADLCGTKLTAVGWRRPLERRARKAPAGTKREPKAWQQSAPSPKPASKLAPIAKPKPTPPPPGRKLDHGAALDRLLGRRKGVIVV